MAKPWKPRASQVGAYLQCLWRAANDRAIHEGRAVASEIGEWKEGPHAPHGTCIHYTTQVGIGCRFLPKEPTDEEVAGALEHFGGDRALTVNAFRTGDHRAYAPTSEEWAKAADMAPGGDPGAHRAMVAKVSQVLASDLSRPDNGRPWIAESAWETDYCTGHIDLLSDDYDDTGDIKTTAKPPEYAKVACKPAHLAQVVLYNRMVGQLSGVWGRKGHIHYIDSKAGAWTYRLPIDFTNDSMRLFSDQMEGFCRFLMSDLLWDVAYPNIGDHCDATWCPYTMSCKKKIMPPPGRWYDVSRAMRPAGILHIGGGRPWAN